MSIAVPSLDFLKIVEPVIGAMPEGPLRDSLSTGYAEEAESLRDIERCFAALTSRRQDPEILRKFFHRWAQTNNSASSVAGLTCRVTLSAKNRPEEDRPTYYRIVDSLQRIIDEDFGAHGEIMHTDLYYRMATGICGDDSWQSKEYGSQTAQEFRSWMLRKRLRDRNLLSGLLFTLIHEVFTHGEVELIHDMFQEWLTTHHDIPTRDARKLLAWVTVHTGGLETEHFGHATDSVLDYCQVSGQTVDLVVAKDLFTTYLSRKAAVMAEMIPDLS
jgi:hypothetical protein